MGILGIGHNGFVVGDLEKSIEFYRDILGFEVEREMDRPERKIVFLKICDGQSIELFSGGNEKAQKSESTIGFAHTCLIIEDMDKSMEELQAKGVEITGVRRRDDGSGAFIVKDPDGNEFEMSQKALDA
ncbi:MAG: VOC family protein [Eubacteriaceae bacterium]|nr:VOC family protein [Eubacteriaceae bacterium]